MANVLAILTPGDSRSQTDDPLTETVAGTPTTVSGPHADDAWSFDASSSVDFTAQDTEIGASFATGAVAFWTFFDADNPPAPMRIGTFGSGYIDIYFFGDPFMGVDFYNDAFAFAGGLELFPAIADDAWAFVYVEWDGTAIRARVNAGAFETGTRDAPDVSNVGPNLLLPIAVASIVGPVVVIDGPLTDQQVDDLSGRTVAWALDMGTAGWGDPPSDTPIAATDTAAVVSTESGTPAAAMAATDTSSVVSTESAAIALSGADTASVVSTNAATLAASLTATDAATATSTETATLAAALTGADTASVTSSESASVAIDAVLVDGTDTTAVVSIESAVSTAALVPTDTASVMSTESATVTVSLAASDVAAVVSGEDGALAVALAAADAAAIVATDVGDLAAQIVIIVGETITSTEGGEVDVGSFPPPIVTFDATAPGSSFSAPPPTNAFDARAPVAVAVGAGAPSNAYDASAPDNTFDTEG